MPGLVTTLSSQLLTGIRSRQSPALGQYPANLYVALLSTNPSFNDMVGAVETPYTGYTAATSRQAIVSSTLGWNAPSTTTGVNAVSMTNAALLTFPTATGAGSITGAALCADNTSTITTQAAFTTQALTSGTVAWNSITTQTVNNTNPVTVAAGALSFQFD